MRTFRRIYIGVCLFFALVLAIFGGWQIDSGSTRDGVISLVCALGDGVFAASAIRGWWGWSR